MRATPVTPHQETWLPENQSGHLHCMSIRPGGKETGAQVLSPRALLTNIARVRSPGASTTCTHGMIQGDTEETMCAKEFQLFVLMHTMRYRA